MSCMLLMRMTSFCISNGPLSQFNHKSYFMILRRLYAVVSLLFYVSEMYETFQKSEVVIIAIYDFYLFFQDQLPLGRWTASDRLSRAQRCPPLCYFCVNDRCVCNINWRPGSRWKRGETQSFSESFLPGCALLCRTSSSHGKRK